jgi:hypothetical protein
MMPVDIRSVWDLVQPLIEEALHGFDDSAEAVYADCTEGRAFFWGCERGYVVLQPILTDILVRAAVSIGPTDCIEAEEQEILRLARGMGGKRVVFHTNRRGFARKMPSNWSKHHEVWTSEL